MATIEPRKTQNGKITRYRVKWRTGGTRDGLWDSETFDLLADAKAFRRLVEAYRHHRPPAEQLLEHGFDFLVPESYLPTSDAGQEESPKAESAPQPPVTFESYAREYVERLVRPNPETKRKYLERLRMHVFPSFGDRPIAEITRREVREWQTALLTAGLSPKTIANIRGESVAPIFKAACLPGEDDEPALRVHNPVEGLALPTQIKAERDILESPEEARIFTAAAYAIDPEAAELLDHRAGHGLEVGRGRGVAAPGGAPSVGHRVHPAGAPEGMSAVEGHPEAEESKQGYREVPVPAEVMTILKRRSELHRDFVFVAPRGNFWRYEDFHRGRWVKIRDLARANGLPKHLTMHGLRHSMLTLLATEGVDLEALRQMAGHKHISTTFDVYVHATRKHHDPVRRIVTDFFGTGRPESDDSGRDDSKRDGQDGDEPPMPAGVAA